MPVNAVVDNFSVQNTAAALNQAAATELSQIDNKDQQKKIDDRSVAKKALEAKSGTSATTEMISDLITKLAGSGVKLSADNFIAKASRSTKDEHDLLFQSKEENSSDSVDIKAIGQRINAAKKLGNQSKGNGQGRGDAYAEAQKSVGTMKEFSSAFVQLLFSGGTEIKKKVEKLEQQLRSEGMGEKELLGLKTTIRNSVRGQLVGQIKESMMKRFLNKEQSLEWIMNNKEVNTQIDHAFFSDKLGGWDFGGYNDHLQGAVDEKLMETRQEVKDFVKDELKSALVRKHLGNDDGGKEIKQLIELGLKAGVNPQQFLSDWKKSMDHLGLTPPPPEAYAQSMLGSGMGGSGQSSQEKTGYEFTKDDEKELFINQLRVLYMQRALRGNMRAVIETSFKIRKLKNGCIKLGVTFGDLDKLEVEGKALAKVKVLEMIKEALYERATLYDLAGPAFQLIESKMKSLIKNLEKLGMELTRTELEALRDQANYRMFDVARNELENTIVLYEGKRYPYLEKKIKLTIRLLKRLKEESNIETDFDPEKRFSTTSSAA